MSLITKQLSLTLHRAQAYACEGRVRKDIAAGGRELGQADTVLFFSEPPNQIYQLQVWLRPFERLAASGQRIGIVVMNALSAQQLQEETTLPLFLSRSIEGIENRLRQAGTRAICYVNNAQANFTMLRMAGPAHIHLNHGESEKSSMVSNQLKAYDRACVAGPAAIERIEKHVPRFDASKLAAIGRPQLDGLTMVPGTGRIRVLYAPTWEGDSKAMAYSSLEQHGEQILSQLAADPRFELRFRPHPKTGSTSARARKLVSRLRKEYRAQLDPVSDAGDSLAQSDVAICDISAMGYDAIALNIPLLVAGDHQSQLTARLPRNQILTSTQALAQTVAQLAHRPPSAAQQALAQYFFATTAPGEATDLLGRLLNEV